MIAEARIGEKTGALLVAVRPGGKKDFAFNPKPDTVLREGDILVFIASPDMAQELAALAGTD
jgi:K+/H+ antiporter YhaU regulatory subunit KhtT